MGPFFRVFPNVTSHLFDTLIQPILLYSSDFWGCLKVPNNNPIENTHIKFCKDLLGVQKQTTNVGVLLELGRVPIMIQGKKNCIKNWKRIHVDGKANVLVLLSHLESIENKMRWPESVTACLNNMGVGVGNISNETVNKLAGQRMNDIFHQESFAEIKREGSKLRTYAKIKYEQGMETYLKQVSNVGRRIYLCKMRLSNHKLMIEKGRHTGLNIHDRNCPLCIEKIVEDEYHFILICPIYSVLRNELLAKVKQNIPTFEHLHKDQQLC